jgi:hypothetical protein
MRCVVLAVVTCLFGFQKYWQQSNDKIRGHNLLDFHSQIYCQRGRENNFDWFVVWCNSFVVQMFRHGKNNYRRYFRIWMTTFAGNNLLFYVFYVGSPKQEYVINMLRTLTRSSVCRFTFRNYLKKKKCLEVRNEICMILIIVRAIRLKLAVVVYIFCLA